MISQLSSEINFLAVFPNLKTEERRMVLRCNEEAGIRVQGVHGVRHERQGDEQRGNSQRLRGVTLPAYDE